MAYIDTSDLESTYTTLEDLDNLLDDVNNDLKDINSNTNSEIRSNSQNIKVDNSKEQKDAVGEVLKSFEIGVEGISEDAFGRLLASNPDWEMKQIEVVSDVIIKI